LTVGKGKSFAEVRNPLGEVEGVRHARIARSIEVQLVCDVIFRETFCPAVYQNRKQPSKSRMLSIWPSVRESEVLLVRLVRGSASVVDYLIHNQSLALGESVPPTSA
jgi:hypothetical protein